MSDFLSRHHANQRKIIGLVLEDMAPWKIHTADYEKALSRFYRADEAENLRINHGWRDPVVRTFCTCLECVGLGEVPNPNWQDDGNPNETETNDCTTCGGRGIVEVVDDPVPIQASALDDEMPF